MPHNLDPHSTLNVSRRQLLQIGGAAALSASIPASLWGAAQPAATAADEPLRIGANSVPSGLPTRKRVLRLAHLSDIHVQPERGAGEGLAAALRHVHALQDKPDLILTGGDLVMDSFEASRERTQTQWDLFTNVLGQECKIPVEHCLGNHDVLGWNKKNSKTRGDEQGWGKVWACDLLGLPAPYRSFERAGWRFIVLDSVFPHEDGYIGRLDDAQWEWLRGTLEQTAATTPVLIVSHIPILTATTFMDNSRKGGDFTVSRSLMHEDMLTFRDLFLKHRNVRVCLSGHMHLYDRLDYNGTTFICDGAVSGSWWKGTHQQTPAGYGVFNLYDDGTFENEYVEYGWAARPA